MQKNNHNTLAEFALNSIYRFSSKQESQLYNNVSSNDFGGVKVKVQKTGPGGGKELKVGRNQQSPTRKSLLKDED